MKRDLQFVGDGKLPEALGISPERTTEMERVVASMIAQGRNLKEILTALNEADLTDAEWTSIVFAIGVFQGRNGY